MANVLCPLSPLTVTHHHAMDATRRLSITLFDTDGHWEATVASFSPGLRNTLGGLVTTVQKYWKTIRSAALVYYIHAIRLCLGGEFVLIGHRFVSTLLSFLFGLDEELNV